MQRLTLLILLFIGTITINGQIKKLETAHFKVTYETETETYALASLKVLDLAWNIADRNGYNLPDRIKFSIIRSNRNVLYFDRKSLKGITLEYCTLNTFASPNEGGKNNIYGLCHELGHLCMYNTATNKNNWMSYNYRESWADFFGNFIIDSVKQELGIDFWPESYNYLKFSGTDYMKSRIDKNDLAIKDFNKACLFWLDLNSKVGFTKMNSFFVEIKEYKVSNPNAKDKFLQVLKNFSKEKDIEAWFNEYADYLILD